MGILYKAETEDISDKPDAAKDAEICRRGIILENFSINEQYKTELSTILQAMKVPTTNNTAERCLRDYKRKQTFAMSKGQILRPTPNTAPLICGACDTQQEGLSTMA